VRFQARPERLEFGFREGSALALASVEFFLATNRRDRIRMVTRVARPVFCCPRVKPAHGDAHGIA
jgi:hypothetical protein